MGKNYAVNVVIILFIVIIIGVSMFNFSVKIIENKKMEINNMLKDSKISEELGIDISDLLNESEIKNEFKKIIGGN